MPSAAVSPCRQANESWQTEEELVAATENLETLQLQPSGLGTQWPGGLAPAQPASSGTLQLVAASPATLQPGPPAGAGVSEMLQPGMGNLEPRLVQLVPEGQGTLLVGPGAVGTLQVLPTGLGMPQLVGPEEQGTQQAGPGAVELQLVLPLVPEGQGTVPGGAGGSGLLQPVAGDPGLLQPVAGDMVLLQPVLGVAEEQEPLPPELRDLEPLCESPEVQQLLQSLEEGLEPGSGTLETLEVAELMPTMPEAADGLLGPRLAGERRVQAGGDGGVPSPLTSPRAAGSDVLLAPHDPFLPQAEDVPVPPISSLFATDLPPLHIDANDFQ